MTIDWNSEESHVLINPSYLPLEKKRFLKIIDFTKHFPSHFWLSTSGSTSMKWVGLSKQAIFASAEAVNKHLQSNASDRWILTLPGFHVGGLGIIARSYLSAASLFNYRQAYADKWQAALFCQYAIETKGTLTSLVPTQVFDLVNQHLKAPPSLRAVIVGGGALSSKLYQRAIELGWPLLPSYGLTECSSQVATADLNSWQKREYPALKLLPHLESKVVGECLCFKGASLLSTYAMVSDETIELINPKQEGWFFSEDGGIIEGQNLSVSGRRDQLIKIGGESVDLAKLEGLFQDLRIELGYEQEMTLVAYPDERLGSAIHLVGVDMSANHLKCFAECFNQHVLPFERIRKMHFLPLIPRSALNKVHKNELLQLIQFISVNNSSILQ